MCCLSVLNYLAVEYVYLCICVYEESSELEFSPFCNVHHFLGIYLVDDKKMFRLLLY